MTESPPSKKSRMTFPVTESPDPGSPIATVVLALCSLFPKKGYAINLYGHVLTQPPEIH